MVLHLVQRLQPSLVGWSHNHKRLAQPVADALTQATSINHRALQYDLDIDAMFHSYSVPAIPSRMPIIALPKRMYTYTFDVSRLPSLRGSAASSLPTVSASAVASSAATSNWGMLGGLWRRSCWSSSLRAIACFRWLSLCRARSFSSSAAVIIATCTFAGIAATSFAASSAAVVPATCTLAGIAATSFAASSAAVVTATCT
eukprot:CAMPEP_0181194100 /NCGR_PEP_ID=MMETSP1096-20121128/14160_1 /TAXON_ID=156174 ORGANISM="Chrysochromulina ericina, Strain CCMP281" /NCGR_SAMPLE_ID=MMETSP1096 /ASSEMBLY_ACC=CAM_ASM_000453 /LENGTH=200 /DNA_ID=CAMNT_0023283587 /DNA_START=74 /DNA_END=674 /DNA_ORIENTATION=+